MAIDVYECPQLDIDFEKRNDVTLDEYIKMMNKENVAASSSLIEKLINRKK